MCGKQFLYENLAWIIAVALTILASGARAAIYSGGSGTEVDPYHIGTSGDWITLTATEADWNKHFLLIADIDFAGASLTPVAPDTSTEDFFQGVEFTGVLDGANHCLKNAVIQMPEDNYAGVFGFLYEPGTVQAMGLENISVTGKDFVGGLVGWNWGHVERCYSTGAVTGRQSVGGLVGFNGLDASIVLCYASGNVSANREVGGLAGSNNGTSPSIVSSYASGTVTGTDVFGGLIGDNARNGTVIACYARGPVISANEYSGGLCGSNWGTIVASFWDVQTTGRDGSFGGKGLNSDQLKTISTFQNANWSAYDWVMTAGDYPRLSWEAPMWPGIPAPDPVPLPGSGTESNPFLINTAAEFALLSWHTLVLDKHIQLAAELDLDGVVLYPVGDLGPFTGEFDGDDHIVRNIEIRQPHSSCVGVFGCLGEGGVINGLGVRNITMEGAMFVGGLVGYNDQGAIGRSHCANGNVQGVVGVGGLVGYNVNLAWVATCYTTCLVHGEEGMAGGLVGYGAEDSFISRSFATGPVTGKFGIGGLTGAVEDGAQISYSYARGVVSGQQWVGGLAGRVKEGTINQCYATGVVTGNQNFGGLVGVAESVQVTDSYWNMETSGLAVSATGEGRTTAEMTSPHAGNTYLNWDFGLEIWTEDESYSKNNGYPYLVENVPPTPIPISNPTDADDDWRITMGEAIAYLAGWQQGDNPIGYAIRAAYIWQNGEQYVYMPIVVPPLCWVLTQ